MVPLTYMVSIYLVTEEYEVFSSKKEHKPQFLGYNIAVAYGHNEL